MDSCDITKQSNNERLDDIVLIRYIGMISMGGCDIIKQSNDQGFDNIVIIR